ncbi:MAG TPA: enoyl-CoA hydratase-related protein [Rhodospirillales bacterium]|nr:enoyl-CoA hydratase-related protein [Rhodospirillales bacterium]
MDADAPVLAEVDGDGVGWLSLNRPRSHNAFDERLIDEATAALHRLAADASVRAVVLRGAGRSFCAGADLNLMRRMGEAGEAENVEDALRLAELLDLLDRLPKPTLALVNGPAYGGGVGLVACCDIAIAANHAVFAMPEVRLGLIPAVISPHVLAAIGQRQARRYFVTGESFSAEEALRIGLVHEVVEAEALEGEGRRILATLAANGPRAMAEVKTLIRDVAGRPMDAALRRDTAERIARARGSEEGRTRIAAFLEKRTRPAGRGDV